jgi:hypothetical protein
MLMLEIDLTDDQEDRLRNEAERRGISLHEAAREVLEAVLVLSPQKRKEIWRNVWLVVGTMHDPGATDVAENHDRYLNGR